MVGFGWRKWRRNVDFFLCPTTHCAGWSRKRALTYHHVASQGSSPPIEFRFGEASKKSSKILAPTANMRKVGSKNHEKRRFLNICSTLTTNQVCQMAQFTKVVWPLNNVFFLHGYTAKGGCRVRLYFCSRSDRGTIFGSEELFGILSQKKIF